MQCHCHCGAQHLCDTAAHLALLSASGQTSSSLATDTVAESATLVNNMIVLVTGQQESAILVLKRSTQKRLYSDRWLQYHVNFNG